ncbi:pentapeptide repeat-containing protein [Streptomyces sp. NPDC005811]|uniref:pentapeptide repeat-containing protein n=1 Tax=Streptomyces sp. NPDC005811 TaxID=3154565 RepID=UPI0034033C58
MTGNEATPENRPTLLDITLLACGETDSDRYALAPADPVALGLHDTMEIAREAQASGALYRTSLEVAGAECDLRTLVLVRLTDNGRAVPTWVVNGWSTIRAHGAGADLRGAGLRGAGLSGAHLVGADLTDADLRGADLTKADLSGAVLHGADLSGSVLFSATLRGADLTECDLSRTDMRHVDLRGAELVRTALRGADLWGSYTWDVDFGCAFTDGVQLDRADALKAKVS